MKKLIVAMAAVATAFAAQAVAVQWADTEILYGGEAVGAGDVLGYAYALDEAGYTFISAYADANGINAAQALIWAGLNDDKSTLTLNNVAYDQIGSAVASDKNGAVVFTGVNGDKGDDIFGATVFTTTQGGSDLYMANAATTTIPSKNAMYDMMATTWGGEDGDTDITWQSAAVPEPTSGLLLLLGVAGLALRRRRA